MCQRSWRMIYMRLKRRGLIDAYIKVPEPSKNGKQHLHIVFRGKYITQAYISELWQEIHKAKIVDIRRVSFNRGKRGIASDMAKYMSGKSPYRYSWSWSWVWKGFCGHWDRLKRAYTYYNVMNGLSSRWGLLVIWRHFVKQKIPDPLLQFLGDWQPSAEEYRRVCLT